jgi:hypothetical protein
MAYTRGVLTTGAGTYGYVQSMDFNEGGEEVLIKDEDGITQVEDLYDNLYEVSVTAKFDRAQTLPARGDAITLAACPKTAYNTNYTIVSMSTGEVNTDAATLTLNLRRFDDGDLPVSA